MPVSDLGKPPQQPTPPARTLNVSTLYCLGCRMLWQENEPEGTGVTSYSYHCPRCNSMGEKVVIHSPAQSQPQQQPELSQRAFGECHGNQHFYDNGAHRCRCNRVEITDPQRKASNLSTTPSSD